MRGLVGVLQVPRQCQPVCRCVEMGEASLAEGTALAKAQRQEHAVCGLAARNSTRTGLEDAGAWLCHVSNGGWGRQGPLRALVSTGLSQGSGGCLSGVQSPQACLARSFNIY